MRTSKGSLQGEPLKTRVIAVPLAVALAAAAGFLAFAHIDRSLRVAGVMGSISEVVCGPSARGASTPCNRTLGH